MMEEFRNPNGTYNGIRMLAKLSGLDEREVAWMATRIQQLMRDEGKDKITAAAIVALEARGKPWLK